MKRKFMGLAFAATASLFAASAATAGTLDDVKAKGFVQCGVNAGSDRILVLRMRRTTGPAWMSISAAPWLPPYSAMRTK